MMVGDDLADRIRSDMGFPLPLSHQLRGWGRAIVEHVQTDGLVDHPPGTVTGTAPNNGGPLQNGAADNGIIHGLDGPTLADLVADYAGYGYVTNRLLILCTEIVEHIMNFGRVEFAVGNIVGNCSNTTVLAGTLTGTGHDGFIKLLNGPVLAQDVHDAEGYPDPVRTRLIQFCTAIVNYIMENAVVTHTSVTATCPANGGAIIDGTALNGTIL